MKRKQVTHQAEMDHVLNLTRVATNNISVLTTRIQALEKLNDSLKDKVLGEAEERSNAACFPKNVKRSVLARRLLNARKNKTRIYNNESTWGRRNMRSKSRSEEFQDNLENFDLKDGLNENYASVQEDDALLPRPQDLATIVTSKPRLVVRHQPSTRTSNSPGKPAI